MTGTSRPKASSYAAPGRLAMASTRMPGCLGPNHGLMESARLASSLLVPQELALSVADPGVGVTIWP